MTALAPQQGLSETVQTNSKVVILRNASVDPANVLLPWVFVGFAGHRQLEVPDMIAGRIVEAIGQIERRSGGPICAVSSVASGADTLFAEAALERGLPWFLLLPFPEDMFRRDFDDDSWARIERLLPRAAGRHVESPQGGSDDLRTLCFQAAGRSTVDECDVLLAVWNGETGKPGGTGEVVAYAREQGKPLVWIHAQTGEIREENFGFLPAPSAHVGLLKGSPNRAAGTNGWDTLEATRKLYSEKASHQGPQTRLIGSGIIWLHLGATAVGILPPVFDHLEWFAAVALLSTVPATIKILSLLGALGMSYRQSHLKQEWLQFRVVAELCRSAAGTWPMRHSERVHDALIVPGFREWQRTLQRWHLFNPPPESSVDSQKQAYLTGRLAHQLGYFRCQRDNARKQLWRWSPIAKACTVLAIAFAAVALGTGLLAGDHSLLLDTLKSILKYLSLILPLASASILAWLTSQDYGRRAARSRDIVGYLEGMQQHIQASRTLESFERLVAEAESMLLLEVLEFNSVSRFASEAH